MNCNQFLRENSRERELALIEQLLCLTDNVCWVFCILPGFISSSVQSLSCVQLFATPWSTACQASLSITNSRSLPKLMSIESVMPSHLIFCHPLHLLPSIFSSIRVFSNASALHMRWPKCWSFSFNIRPSNKHSGLISYLSPVVSHYIQGNHSLFWMSKVFTDSIQQTFTKCSLDFRHCVGCWWENNERTGVKLKNITS